jgi:putative ABC transport system permease protein
MPYTISFFDEVFDKDYKADRQLGTLINIFSLIAIVIACLGLYGVSLHSVTQRTKEIGIRKALGAEITQLIMMLSRKYLMLTALAFVLVSPVIYYVMEQWLLQFAYHVSIAYWFFLLSIMGMMGIATLTIATQVWQAANSNPVQALRSE